MTTSCTTADRDAAVGRTVIEPASCTLPVDVRSAKAGSSPHRTRTPPWLLGPDARKAGKSGSEGASAQQCAGATRQSGLVLGELEVSSTPHRVPATRTSSASGWVLVVWR